MVVSADDEIDLLLATLGPQVGDMSLRCLGIDPDAERDQGLEERA